MEAKEARRLVLEGPGRLALRHGPRPDPGPDGVVARVRYNAICGSDVRLLAGSIPVRYPLVPGHEWSGEVECAAPRFEHWIGRAVVADTLHHCGRCRPCHRGQPGLCANLVETGFTLDGACADYVVVRGANVRPLPEDLPLAEAALVEPLAVALHALDRVPVVPGEPVVVFGAGGIGLLLLQLARLAGAGRVLVVDPTEQRRMLATRLGADLTCPPDNLIDCLKGAHEPEAVFDASGQAEAFALALECVRPGGRIALVGYSGAQEVTLRPSAMMLKEVRVSGVLSPVGTWDRAVDLLAQRRVQVGPLLTQRFPLEAYKEAFATAANGANSVRVCFEL